MKDTWKIHENSTTTTTTKKNKNRKKVKKKNDYKYVSKYYFCILIPVCVSRQASHHTDYKKLDDNNLFQQMYANY